MKTLWVFPFSKQFQIYICLFFVSLLDSFVSSQLQSSRHNPRERARGGRRVQRHTECCDHGRALLDFERLASHAQDEPSRHRLVGGLHSFHQARRSSPPAAQSFLHELQQQQALLTNRICNKTNTPRIYICSSFVFFLPLNKRIC